MIVDSMDKELLYEDWGCRGIKEFLHEDWGVDMEFLQDDWGRYG